MFDIGLPEGQELSPKFTKGLVRYVHTSHLRLRAEKAVPRSYPEPFDCIISARSDSKLAQILSRAAQCTV